MRFLTIFNNSDRPWDVLSLKLKEHKYGISSFLFTMTGMVRDQLYQLNVHKSLGPDGIHPRVPEGLVKLWQDLSQSGTKGLGSLGREVPAD